MEETKNLCAQMPLSLHARIQAERTGKRISQKKFVLVLICQVLNEKEKQGSRMLPAQHDELRR